jgi:hypothetical protein
MGIRIFAITRYPNRYPKTICIYVRLLLPTHPGTDINVTPDREVPIIPKATTNHGDFLFPRKKPAFVALRDVKNDITRRIIKYATTIDIIVSGFIKKFLTKNIIISCSIAQFYKKLSLSTN